MAIASLGMQIALCYAGPAISAVSGVFPNPFSGNMLASLPPNPPDDLCGGRKRHRLRVSRGYPRRETGLAMSNPSFCMSSLLPITPSPTPEARQRPQCPGPTASKARYSDRRDRQAATPRLLLRLLEGQGKDADCERPMSTPYSESLSHVTKLSTSGEPT